MSNTVNKNGQILGLYQGRMTNFNGDPDHADKPRMDYKTERILTSSVWMHRRSRDYLEKEEKHAIYYSACLIKKYQEEKGKYPSQPDFVNWLKSKTPEELEKLGLKKFEEKEIEEDLKKFIDIRLFGGLCITESSSNNNKGKSIPIPGPVQFTWSYSLFPVDIVESKSINAHFASKDKEYNQRTFGKKYQVYYALLPVYATISGVRANDTGMTEDDLKALDRAVIKSPYSLATSSKAGITPLLYLRVHGDDNEIIPDLRDFISAVPSSANPSPEESIRSIYDINLHLDGLSEILKELSTTLEKMDIYYWYSPALDKFNKNYSNIKGLEELKSLLKNPNSKLNCYRVQDYMKG